MVYIREFEIFETEGVYAVFPRDMPGATQGDTFDDEEEDDPAEIARIEALLRDAGPATA